MTEVWAFDLATLILRVVLGVVMLAHGWNHIFGPGKIEATAKWFASLGMRPPLVQAWMASLTELGSGALLLAGLLTPFGCGGVIGVMTVAFVTAHRKNGFFIFKPGQGYEYVLTLALAAFALALLGGGGWSLDRALSIDDSLDAGAGLVIAGVAGVGGAVVLLAACWRPPRS